jgi:hypothetical protein
MPGPIPAIREQRLELVDGVPLTQLEARRQAARRVKPRENRNVPSPSQSGRVIAPSEADETLAAYLASTPFG